MNREDLLFWLSWCTEEYAQKSKISPSEIADLFETKNVYDYLEGNADVLHTQGKDYILSCIDEILGN